MKYSTQPTPLNLEKDFGPEWSNHLRSTIVSTLELIIVEQEAWKDQAHLRDNTLADPRPVDPWRCLTPPGTPLGEEDEKGENIDDAVVLEEEHDPAEWALIKYEYDYQRFERAKAHQLRTSLDTQNFAMKIVLYVLLAVLLHGIWTHWNESEKHGTCD
jgi:hypothetical protein